MIDGVTASQLCGYISRVEGLEAEIKGLQDDKSEIFKEARTVGFDVPTLKRVIRRRREEQPDAQDDPQLALYEDIVNSILG